MTLLFTFFLIPHYIAFHMYHSIFFIFLLPFSNLHFSPALLEILWYISYIFFSDQQGTEIAS